MHYLEWNFLRLCSGRLSLYKETGQHKAVFRCPFCGDSKKNEFATKGSIFPVTDTLMYHCYLCGVSWPFSHFLYVLDKTLYNDFITEKFKGSRKTRKRVRRKTSTFKMPTYKEILPNSTPLSLLGDQHPVVKYVSDRLIPKDKFHLLSYTSNFKEFVGEYYPEYDRIDKLRENEPRLLIPFYDENSSIPIVQGRALSGDGLRYITIKRVDSAKKVYGLDRIDRDKRIFIVEGAIDSLFVDNCLASADSTLSNVAFSTDNVLIHDNEPRSKNICKIMSSSISKGHPIVIFPETIDEKDINMMVLAGYDVNKIIEENIYSGLNAELRLSEWKRI